MKRHIDTALTALFVVHAAFVPSARVAMKALTAALGLVLFLTAPAFAEQESTLKVLGRYDGWDVISFRLPAIESIRRLNDVLRERGLEPLEAVSPYGMETGRKSQGGWVNISPCDEEFVRVSLAVDREPKERWFHEVKRFVFKRRKVKYRVDSNPFKTARGLDEYGTVSLEGRSAEALLRDMLVAGAQRLVIRIGRKESAISLEGAREAWNHLMRLCGG